MNTKFKNEFKNLIPEDIKLIINRCAGMDILEYDVVKDISHNYSNKYFLKYIDDDRYGYWVIGYGWKKVQTESMSIGSGIFEYQIKITPFRVYFENNYGKALNPYSKQQKQKQLEEYMLIYINKKCPNYKNAIIEETKEFIKFIEGSTKANQQTK